MTPKDRKLWKPWKPCTSCGGIRAPSSVYCRPCHARNMAVWRAGRVERDEERKKSSARAYANSYRMRGKLIAEACACGAEKVQMHHADYEKPLDVEWKCAFCHEWHHKLPAEVVT